MLLNYLSSVLTSIHYAASIFALFVGILLFVELVMGFDPAYYKKVSIKTVTIMTVVGILVAVVTPADLIKQRDNFWKNSYYEMKENNDHHRNEVAKANKQIAEFNAFLSETLQVSAFTEFDRKYKEKSGQ